MAVRPLLTSSIGQILAAFFFLFVFLPVFFSFNRCRVTCVVGVPMRACVYVYKKEKEKWKIEKQ